MCVCVCKGVYVCVCVYKGVCKVMCGRCVCVKQEGMKWKKGRGGQEGGPRLPATPCAAASMLQRAGVSMLQRRVSTNNVNEPNKWAS